MMVICILTNFTVARIVLKLIDVDKDRALVQRKILASKHCGQGKNANQAERE